MGDAVSWENGRAGGGGAVGKKREFVGVGEGGLEDDAVQVVWGRGKRFCPDSVVVSMEDNSEGGEKGQVNAESVGVLVLRGG